MNRGLKENICETFQEGNAEWILVQEETQRMIWDTLESEYEVVKREKGYGICSVSQEASYKWYWNVNYKGMIFLFVK